MSTQKRIGILGFGGIGMAAAKIIAKKEELKLVAACDTSGYVFDPQGLEVATLESRKAGVGVASCTGGVADEDSIGALIRFGEEIDGFIVSLPNLPNEFIPGVITRMVEEGYKGTFVDALKRTQAMEQVLALSPLLAKHGCTYITGAGCTPGLLSAAAVLAAQSFTEVEHVDIHWGVGISNWEQYRGTIREDIAHMPGYDVEKARAMSDEEVDRLLEERKGILELRNMEHADDVLLQREGIVKELDQVTVGGIMDTRNAKKPVSTTLTVTGTTFEGKKSAHRFILGDETSMAANVLGPALGYLKRAFWLHERGIHGVFGSTEFMPQWVK